MGLYELKMYLKRTRIARFILKARSRILMKRQKGGILESKGLDTIMAVEEALSGTDICYFADYGTLLGIIRDNKLISWDDDIDYGILADDSFDWKGFEKQLSLFGFRKIKEFKYKEKIDC